MRYGTTLRNVIPSLFCTFFLGFGSLSALAQKPVARITAEISNEQRTPIAGSRSPMRSQPTMPEPFPQEPNSRA